MNCRHCKSILEHVFLDLGFSPPSNAYLSKEDLTSPETWFPLKLFVCSECWLVQTEDYSSADDLFHDDYAYFSSTSSSWVAHASRYANDITGRIGLTSESLVVEVASNDGYLLKNFVEAGIPCLGIEPTVSTAKAASALGIPVLQEFFGSELAARLSQNKGQADLIIGNNVYAHVPDINDFTLGLSRLLKQNGTITLEFPHLMRLIEHCQFDTVYHEHFSYLSLFTVSRIFESVGLRVFDVEELTTHGGSLRVFGCHDNDERSTSDVVGALLSEESRRGMRGLEIYLSFQQRAEDIKVNLLRFLIDQKQSGKRVAAYGAAAKGCTLLNYAGVRPDLLPYVCDAAPSKQGKYLPGSHIPIVSPDVLSDRKPDIIMILPWNIAGEIVVQQNQVKNWGGEFVVAVPVIKTL